MCVRTVSLPFPLDVWKGERKALDIAMPFCYNPIFYK